MKDSIKNLFVDMSDERLHEAFADYECYRMTGLIPSGGTLAPIQGEYREKIGGKGVYLMEMDMLYAIAIRWRKEHLGHWMKTGGRCTGDEMIDEILNFLEESYIGARIRGNEYGMLKIAHAIAALKAPVNMEIFTEEFKKWWYNEY